MYIFLKVNDLHNFIYINKKDKNVLFGKNKRKMFLFNAKTSVNIEKIVKSYDFFKYCKNITIN